MKILKFFFIFCIANIFCFLSYASIGDELNNLLQNFFSVGEPENKNLDEEKNKKDTEIQENFSVTSKDKTKIQKQIFDEEESLNFFEKKIQETEKELYKTREKKNSLQTDLFLIDKSLGLSEKKLENLLTQEKKWKKDLENITYIKSNLKAELRILNREQQKILSKNFIKNESLGEGDQISTFKWLFSNKTVSQILADKKQEKKVIQKNNQKITDLKKIKQKLDIHEKNTAFLYEKIFELSQRIAKEQKNLKNLTQAKANLVARLEFTEGEKLKNIDIYRKEKEQSTIFLQNLYAAMSNAKKEQKENIAKFGPKFDPPLKIPLEITAKFHDPEYKKEFGKIHNGVDFFAPQGTDIFAPADGVIKKTASNGYGYSYMVLEHDKKYYTVYGHLSEILKAKDEEIKKGDLIARTGGTPGSPGSGYFSAGPHLHFEIFYDGEFLNPMDFLNK